MKPSSWQALSRVFVVFGLLWGSAQAQEATIKRATELREAPGDQAASRGALAADSSVARTGDRKGSWVKVRTPQGTEGWVHMFDLGSQPATASSNSTASGLRSVGGLFGGGSTTTATATVGIRGLSAEDIVAMQLGTAQVTVDAAVIDYAVRIVAATRKWPGIALGAGPRGSLALVRASRAQAVLAGRDFVTPDDIRSIAKPALRHRIALSPEMQIEGQTPDQVLEALLAKVEAPRQ